MRVIGIVKEVTDDALLIERTVTAEAMEFALEKPLDKIETGDKVTISYIKTEEKNIAKRVTKAIPKKKAASPRNVVPTPRPPLPAK